MKQILLLLIFITSLFANISSVIDKTDKAVVRVINFAKNLTATGFIINQDGFVITNHHVIDGFEEGKILLKSKYLESSNIKVIKSYSKEDIAILKIKNYSKPYYLSLQTPKDLKKGEDSIALGFPASADIIGGVDALIESKATDGIVSAIVKTKDDFKMIQTSAPINGGNSGGPLLNSKGFVIGINTIKPRNDLVSLLYGSSSSEGIGWAIHVKELIKILNQNHIHYDLSSTSIFNQNKTVIFSLIGIILTLSLLSIIFFKNRVKSTNPNLNLSPNKLNRDKTDISTKKIQLLAENGAFPKINLKENERYIVGRGENNNITINDEFISKKHFKITLQNNQIYITDLNSTNGTYINGKKLTPNKSYLLKDSEKLIVGSENVIYKKV